MALPRTIRCCVRSARTAVTTPCTPTAAFRVRPTVSTLYQKFKSLPLVFNPRSILREILSMNNIQSSRTLLRCPAPRFATGWCRLLHCCYCQIKRHQACWPLDRVRKRASQLAPLGVERLNTKHTKCHILNLLR